MSERNNNDWYRSTKSRSPDVTFGKGTKTDIRKLSSGYFVCMKFFSFLLYFWFCFYEMHLKNIVKCVCWHQKKIPLILFGISKFTFNHHFSLHIYHILPPFFHLILYICNFFFICIILLSHFSINLFLFCFVLFFYCTHKLGECCMLPNHFVFLFFSFGYCCYHYIFT